MINQYFLPVNDDDYREESGSNKKMAVLGSKLTDSNWYLEGNLETGKTWTIQINKNPFYIGRNEDCNLTIADNTISRKHAEIFLKGTTLAIRDLESTNGTFVNDKRIKNYELLRSGDTIKFANISFQILLKDQRPEHASADTFFLSSPQKSGGFTDYYELTRREEEILYFLLQGKSTKDIADKFYITPGTAKNHILNIYKKTNVHSKFELLTLYNNFKDQ